MTYTATVHQPGDVIHTAGHDGRIRVWSVAPDGTPTAVEQEPTPAPDPAPVVELVTETLAYVDKTVDNVADLPTDLPWSNAEVVGMLEDIRSLLITGRVGPHGG